MAGNDDKLYSPGGADAVDGNYARDLTIASRAGRLYQAKRGFWPGGRGRIIGNDLFNLKKFDEQTPADVARMVDAAWEPLTASGEMSDIVVHPEALAEGVLGNEIDFTDRTIGDTISRTLPTGRKG
jgi:phage gp46-like protein